jgi:hypothetical protein
MLSPRLPVIICRSSPHKFVVADGAADTVCGDREFLFTAPPVRWCILDGGGRESLWKIERVKPY